MVSPVVMYGYESWTINKAEYQRIDTFRLRTGEDSWEFLGMQDQTSPSERKSVLNILWKDWCWRWNSNFSTTWWEELTHWKRLWFWEDLGQEEEWDDREWDTWLDSITYLMGMNLSKLQEIAEDRGPGMLQSMALQRVRYDLATEQQQ